jgi:hypothetical protein
MMSEMISRSAANSLEGERGFMAMTVEAQEGWPIRKRKHKKERIRIIIFR